MLLSNYDRTIQTSIREGTFEGLGSGFLTLPESGTIGKLRDCLLCTAAITDDLEALRPYQPNSPKFRHLLRAARGVHHRLLSLPMDIEDFGTVESEEYRLLYRISCLAALLYHDIVIFPHVDTSGIKPQLAERLRQVLGEGALDIVLGSGSDRYSGIVLWALLLGSIGATWTSHQYWFIEQLRSRNQQLGIANFEQFKTFMSQYLWFENVDEPALKVWVEMTPATKSSDDND